MLKPVCFPPFFFVHWFFFGSIVEFEVAIFHVFQYNWFRFGKDFSLHQSCSFRCTDVLFTWSSQFLFVWRQAILRCSLKFSLCCYYFRCKFFHLLYGPYVWCLRRQFLVVLYISLPMIFQVPFLKSCVWSLEVLTNRF